MPQAGRDSLPKHPKTFLIQGALLLSGSRKSRVHFDFKPRAPLLSPESHIRFGCGSRRIKNVFDLCIHYNDHLAKSQLYIFPIFIAVFSGIMPISQFPLSKSFGARRQSHHSNAAPIVVVGASLHTRLPQSSMVGRGRLVTRFLFLYCFLIMKHFSRLPLGLPSPH